MIDVIYTTFKLLLNSTEIKLLNLELFETCVQRLMVLIVILLEDS